MNFYDFCYNYLLKQSLEQAKLEEGYLQKYFKCNLYSWEPYFTVTRGKETKKDLMKMFAFILQNRFILPSIINFCDNYENLKKILNEFDDEYIRQNNKKIHDELEAYYIRAMDFLKAEEKFDKIIEELRK